VTLATTGTVIHTEHDDEDDVIGRGPTPILHTQDVLLGELRGSLEVGIAERLAVAVLVPIRYIDTRIRYLDAATGDEVTLTMPDIHHRNETLFRLADPWLTGRAVFPLADWRLEARAGASLPLGHTEPDPFVLGDEELEHEHIQFGTGTVNPILALEVRRAWGRHAVALTTLTQQVLYENGKGYQAGDKYAATLAAVSPLGTELWSFRAGPEVQLESAERWHGVEHSDDGNRGRIDVLAMAGASRHFENGLFVAATVRARLYTHIVGGQLTYPAVAELSVGWTGN